MTDRTTAQQLADQLNEYDGDNEWQDVIYENFYDHVDQEATEAADPSGQSDIVVLEDGSHVIYDNANQEWVG